MRVCCLLAGGKVCDVDHGTGLVERSERYLQHVCSVIFGKLGQEE